VPGRRRAVGELRRRVRRLQLEARERALLAEFGQLLHACQVAEEAYAVIGRIMPLLMPMDAGAVYELTPARTGLVPVVGWGKPAPVQRVFAPGDCWGLRRGTMHVVDGTGARLRCRHVEEPPGRGQLCMPLSAQGETFGLLHLQVRTRAKRRRRSALLADRLGLATAVTDTISLALANIRVRDALREQSSRDALTGLFNRRYMEESLDRELRRAMRERYSLGLIMADLDHLKAFNDAYGHAVGDMVLQLVGSFLQASVRHEDIACRFGGEEFVVIMPKASLEDTRRRAEVIRQGLESQRVDPLGPDARLVTMSFGVAAYPDHGASVELLLHSADEALYRAKAGGRNRVVAAGVEPPQGIGIVGGEPRGGPVHAGGASSPPGGGPAGRSAPPGGGSGSASGNAGGGGQAAGR
jgi:diguanylate cyclase (GGDEF)-like protein